MSGSSEIAIHVANLSKVFKIYAHPSDMFREMVRGKPRYKPFWALQDVSFDVHKGQVVGILGRNGAGKSTLLKIITGTLDKTSGEVQAHGRISSILELGTGFSGEYTGRENIYLGGLMVGLSREEIKQKEEWIIDFSELRDFIDQPFKTYSTGMQARLTFSTAICIDPDIVIVDEALSVGDARFSRKSFAKIQQFRDDGQTILLVSHDMNTISTFCDHVIMLENGRVFEQGEPQRVSKVYFQRLFASAEEKQVDVSEQEDDPSQVKEVLLDVGKMKHESRFAWQVDISDAGIRGDTIEAPRISNFVLFEDDKKLAPAHTAHSQIRKVGRGAYSHWDTQLYFSTSDNSDPRINGRVYLLKHQYLLDQSLQKVDIDSDRATLRNNALEKLGLKKVTISNSSRLAPSGNKKAEIIDFCILNDKDERIVHLTSAHKYTFLMRALIYEDIKSIYAGFLIRDQKGVDVFGTSTLIHELRLPAADRGEIVEFRLKVTMWLTNGIYFLSYSLGNPDAEVDTKYDMYFDGLQFEISYKETIYATSIVNLDEQLSFTYLS